MINTDWKPSKDFECYFKIEDGHLIHAEMNVDDSMSDQICQVCRTAFEDESELQEYLDEASKVLGITVTKKFT